MYHSFNLIHLFRDAIVVGVLKQVGVVDDKTYVENLGLLIKNTKEKIVTITPEKPEARDSIIELGVLLHLKYISDWMIEANKKRPPTGDYLYGTRGSGTGFSNSLHYTEKKGFYEVKKLYGKSEGEVVLMTPKEVASSDQELDFLKYYMQVIFHLRSHPPYFNGLVSTEEDILHRLMSNAGSLRQIKHTLRTGRHLEENLESIEGRKEYMEFLLLNDLFILASESPELMENLKDKSREELLELANEY